MDGEPLPEGLDYLTRLGESTATDTIREWLLLLPPGCPRPAGHPRHLGKAMPAAEQGETPYLRDYRLAGELKLIADDRPGMSLLVLHHDRKATRMTSWRASRARTASRGPSTRS